MAQHGNYMGANGRKVSSMRLAWYTPYSQFSAIGAFSREIIVALQKMGHEIVLIRCEMQQSEVAKTQATTVCEIVHASSIESDLENYLHGFDMVIYNVGNHLPNHFYALEHQVRVPGITILHDYILHNLLAEWACCPGKNTYRDVLYAEAGEEAIAEYDEALRGDVQRDWYMSKATRHPVLRFAVQGTLGIVTHANFYRFVADYLVHCPVATIPLAYPCEFESNLSKPTKKHQKLRLITIGDVNVNKLCEPVITSIGSCASLSSTWQYRIVGKVTRSYEKHLRQLAQSCDYPVDLAILGKVEASVLEAELEKANAISCLRFPIIEGASASVVLSLASGRPTLVSDGGSFAEIPDELVYRVRIPREVNMVREHLTAIATDYDAAVRRAGASRSWAVARHSGKNYAEMLLPFIELVHGERPILELSDEIGECLKSWECPADSPTIDRVDRAIETLFSNLQLASSSG